MYRHRLTRSGPLTHAFVEEAQAVAIVMQESENAKKPAGSRGDSAVKVAAVDTTELTD